MDFSLKRWGAHFCPPPIWAAKKACFLPPFQVFGHVAHMFFRFLLHRFCVFLHDFCIFSHLFVKFSAWANANWQISGVICCVFDDHFMQILHNFPTCMVEITQHALLYSWNYPARPERAEAPSPGHRPGFLLGARVARPVRAKALHIAEDFHFFY